MTGPILNASDLDINASAGSLPNMSETLFNYFRPMVFTQLRKSIVNFKSVETPYSTNTDGVMQPLTEQQLKMKPEGQRSWIWQQLHALPNLILKPDEVVGFKGVQYRVMTKKDYSDFGYVEYHLVQDYTGSGPTT